MSKGCQIILNIPSILGIEIPFDKNTKDILSILSIQKKKLSLLFNKNTKNILDTKGYLWHSY